MSENRDQIGTIFFKKSLIGTGPYKKGPSFHHWLVAYLPPNQMSKYETNVIVVLTITAPVALAYFYLVRSNE